jgi:hypothetical protein
MSFLQKSRNGTALKKIEGFTSKTILIFQKSNILFESAAYLIFLPQTIAAAYLIFFSTPVVPAF